jgi:hypothetical protein
MRLAFLDRRRVARAVPIARIAVGVLLTGGLLAGCGIAANDDVGATSAITPQASLSATLQICRNELTTTLATAGLPLTQPQSPVRPAESPLLTAAPRTVGQVILPADPDHGYIVLYSFPDPASAYTAAQQQAAYIGGGEGRIQFVPDTQFVLRQDGSCVLFYNWSPTASTDPRSPDIATALETFGVGIAIPR